MKVLCIMHFRSPFQNAGSEIAMHTALRALQAAGHTVTIITTDTPMAPAVDGYEGMTCYSTGPNRQKIHLITKRDRPDVIITHHQRAEIALPLGRQLRIPTVLWVHNDMSHSRRELAARPTLAMFNSHWVKDKLAWAGRSIVVHPPVVPPKCDMAGSKVTLVNLNRDKGGEIFYMLAGMLPEIEFLGVVGAHGHQVINETLPNVEIQPHTTNMCADVWAKTGIVIMPSIYESYGMVALEAASLGIPVLANPTPGLQESMGEGAWFIDRKNLPGYAKAISVLKANAASYYEWASKSLRRFSEIDTEAEMSAFVKTVEELKWTSR